MCSQSDCYKVIFVVILVLVQNADCRTVNKFRKDIGVHNAWNNLQSVEKNTTNKEQGRGFFFGGMYLQFRLIKKKPT